MNNPWQLYATRPGWPVVAARLEIATVTALAGMEVRIANGVPRARAAEAAFADVLAVLDAPANAGYGCGDSEPRDHLAARIADYFERRGHHLVINRWGRVC